MFEPAIITPVGGDGVYGSKPYQSRWDANMQYAPRPGKQAGWCECVGQMFGYEADQYYMPTVPQPPMQEELYQVERQVLPPPPRQGPQAMGGYRIYQYGSRSIRYNEVPVPERNWGVVVNMEAPLTEEMEGWEVGEGDSMIRNRDWVHIGRYIPHYDPESDAELVEKTIQRYGHKANVGVMQSQANAWKARLGGGAQMGMGGGGVQMGMGDGGGRQMGMGNQGGDYNLNGCDGGGGVRAVHGQAGYASHGQAGYAGHGQAGYGGVAYEGDLSTLGRGDHGGGGHGKSQGGHFTWRNADYTLAVDNGFQKPDYPKMFEVREGRDRKSVV